MHATDVRLARTLPTVGPDRGRNDDLRIPRIPDLPTGAPRVLWLALRYSVRDRAARAAAWRRLQKLEAVNIEPGLWGVCAGPAEADQLEAVVALIKDAGGDALVEEVGWHPEAEVALSSRLERACERLWDELFNATEWYAATVAVEATASDERMEQVARLYDAFAQLAARDIVQSQALDRAECVVTTHAADLIAATDVDPSRWRPVSRVPGRRVRARARVVRSDGSAAFVAQVRPGIGPLWEVAFHAFERRTFAPDPTRPELRAGTFRWVGEAVTEAAALDGLARRVRLFEASLA